MKIKKQSQIPSPFIWLKTFLFLFKNTILLSLITKISGSYFPQEFDPDSGDYISASKIVNSALTSDLLIQYIINSKDRIKFGLKNLGNYTIYLWSIH